MKDKPEETTEPFPPDIMNGLVMGKSPAQIAQETGRPLKSVYQILKEMERTIRTVLEKDAQRARYSLRGTLLFYNDPTAPVGEDDWDALK